MEQSPIMEHKVFDSQSDLSPKDRPRPEMVHWCRQQKTIVVLESGIILCANLASRQLQNCKVVMLNKGFTPGAVHQASESLITMLLENAIDIEELHDNAGENTVSNRQQRLRTLIKEALSAQATDIHMEVREDIARIRFRKHGELYLHAEWLTNIAREVVSVAFNQETDHSVTHFNPLIPQNASMPIDIDQHEVRLRLASLPAHGGFDVVLRILTAFDLKVAPLEKLGYGADQIAALKKAVSMPHGAVIVSGPTGSGKTTSLASCIKLIEEDRKVYTIEDPVEKIVHGATQVPVNTEHYDRSFSSMARTVLRMDPDVIVLGEMRDEDTAKIMTRAAITGHLVFTTLHTNSATGIITRMNDLGIENTLLSSPNLLVTLVCQRLAPVLCDRCSRPLLSSPAHQPMLARWKKQLGDHFHDIRVRGHKECSQCQGLGITSRTIVAEIIWVDEKAREFILRGELFAWEQHLKAQGWRSHADQLLDKVRTGVCDPLDAERIIGEIDS